jgi:isopentenyl-diphosphate delta-isomerase
MTGGTPQAERINQNLAIAAHNHGIAMALGSQRASLEQAGPTSGFQIREIAPDILLFANLGAVQLNYGFGLEHAQRAVEMAQADALFLHLNPLQEALQPEGDVDFSGLLTKIGSLCEDLEVPVFVKEVGWGISAQTARQLASVGVSGVDVAGAGGTSWSQVEAHRAKSERQAQVARHFVRWGIPTADALAEVRASLPEITLFASGGIRNGIEVAKCIALGADMVGLASPFLRAAANTHEAVEAVIADLVRELTIAMFASGCGNLSRLREAGLLELR